METLEIAQKTVGDNENNKTEKIAIFLLLKIFIEIK
jgi:hypothetical protein